MHELLGARLHVANGADFFERTFTAEDPAWLAHHRIAGAVVMPMTAYLEMAWAAARIAVPGAVALENVEVAAPMRFTGTDPRIVQVSVEPGSAGATDRVRIHSRGHDDTNWQLHASCVVSRTSASAPASRPTLADIEATLPGAVDVSAFYGRLAAMGVEFGAAFQGMTGGRFGDGEAMADVVAPGQVAAGSAAFNLHPALLDACFHASAEAMDRLPGADDGRLYLPVGVDRIEWRGAPEGALRSHARIRPPLTRGEMLVLDIRVETPDGRAVVDISGLRCRRASRQMFRQALDAQVEPWLYAREWEPAPAQVSGDGRSQNWLVFDEGGGVGRALADEIAQRGSRVTRVVAAPGR
ncbi:MAG: polyketide synthase dehydratase domain-containing protein [Vicinamibacterales bacterium]